MAYKVNYGLERAERNRAKQAKKEAKLRDKKAGIKSDEPDENAEDEAPESTPLPPAKDA
ncbi:MAG TPA: hypothetical protein PK231_13500 [Acidocella sp.]|jgi:hypothetical protein|nr:hypothetical protein [Acidocella sp.]